MSKVFTNAHAQLHVDFWAAMGISRDSWHKRRATGGKRKAIRKKRKFEIGRPPANTKIGQGQGQQKRIHTVRTRGGNRKFRALRLDSGNFSWGSEGTTRKTRILDVVYNASNNELVRTKTLVKNCIVQIDSTPFRQWYESYYVLPIGRKKLSKKEKKEEEKEKEGESTDVLNQKRSKHVKRKITKRRPNAKVDARVEEQFLTGRLYACVSSRPGQSGRCDGYILEGRELEFYLKKLKSKKGK